ncbi:GMC family oxidoreductase N-terminal domain-containing protein [Burkholderia aenigmatica]|nr:GMC family oxidoreductase N-terminal domain-containing protein [Burkholderia aenigmatica]
MFPQKDQPRPTSSPLPPPPRLLPQPRRKRDHRLDRDTFRLDIEPILERPDRLHRRQPHEAAFDDLLLDHVQIDHREPRPLARRADRLLQRGFTKTYYNRRYNWMYYSEPEAQLADRKLYCPRGKVVGGAGSINAMAYVNQ